MNLKTFFFALLAAYGPSAHAEAKAVDPDSMSLNYYQQCSYQPSSTSFRFLGNPIKGKVTLRLYDDALGGKPVRTVKMKKREYGGWTAEVKGDWKGKFYTFDISNDAKNPLESPGVFATAVGVNGRRGAVIDMNSTDPPDGARTTD